MLQAADGGAAPGKSLLLGQVEKGAGPEKKISEVPNLLEHGFDQGAVFRGVGVALIGEGGIDEAPPSRKKGVVVGRFRLFFGARRRGCFFGAFFYGYFYGYFGCNMVCTPGVQHGLHPRDARFAGLASAFGENFAGVEGVGVGLATSVELDGKPSAPGKPIDVFVDGALGNAGAAGEGILGRPANVILVAKVGHCEQQ